MAWVGRCGRGGVASGTLLVGNRLYGYHAGLLKRLKAGVRQQVRSSVQAHRLPDIVCRKIPQG